ncbi:MAG: YfiR family protein, partial [Woeseiaceae bacterium]
MNGLNRQESHVRTPFGGVPLLLVVASWFWPVSLPGQVIDSVSEQSVKAAYLYRFASYVDWPEGVLDDPSTPLTIAVLGADSLADELEMMTADRTVEGRRIAVRRVRTGEALDGVHILFVAAAGADELVRLTPEARARSALVVTETGDALEFGSVINFRAVNQRIRFEVSL